MEINRKGIVDHVLLERLNREIARGKSLEIDLRSAQHSARQAEQYIAGKGLWEEYMTLRVVARMEE